MHNVGDFRYLEASRVEENGELLWRYYALGPDPVPFRSGPGRCAALETFPVSRSAVQCLRRLRNNMLLRCGRRSDSDHSNRIADYVREYRLGRWSGKTAVVTPSARKAQPQSNFMKNCGLYDLGQPYYVGMPHHPVHPPYLFGLVTAR